MSLQQIREDILKGCGKKNQDNCPCGKLYSPINYIKARLCPVCQAKLSTLDLIEKEISDNIEGLDDKFINLSTMNYTTKGDTWTILKQDWNKLVSELKSKLSQAVKG
jgi:hypothetical protein